MLDWIVNMEVSLEAIAKWLRGSGLVVNNSKPEMRVFLRLDQPHIKIKFFK
jgi:hypothetical protein